MARVPRICSSKKLTLQITVIKNFASWNDCSKLFVNLVMNKLFLKAKNNDTINDNMVNNKAYPVIIYFGVLYYGDKRVSLIKSCIRTMKPNYLKDRLIVFTLNPTTMYVQYCS